MANDVDNNNESSKMTGSIDLKGSAAAPSIPPGFCGKLAKKHSLPSPSSAEKAKKFREMADTSLEGTFKRVEKQMVKGTSDKSINAGYLPSLSGTMDTDNDSKFNLKKEEAVLDTSINVLKVDYKRWSGNEKQGTNKVRKKIKVRSYADLFKRKAKVSDRILETIETLPPKRGCNVIRPNCSDDVEEREDDSCVSNSKRQRVDLDPSQELHSYSSPKVVCAGSPMSRSPSKVPISLHDTRDRALEGEDDKYERGVGNHHGRELTEDYIIDGQNNTSLIELESDRDHVACVECLKGGEILHCSGEECKRGYHLSCLDPPLSYVPPGAWHCIWCVRKKIVIGVHSVCNKIESIWDVRDAVSNDQDQRQKQYLVKYQGLAHIHNRWLPEMQMLIEAPDLLNKFYKRNEVGRWKADWTVPNRLLEKRLLIFPKNDDDESCTGNADINLDCHNEWLVKWTGLQYDHATWELDNASFLKSPDAMKLIREYESRHNKAEQSSPNFKPEEGKGPSLKELPEFCSGSSFEFDECFLSYVNKLREYWNKVQNAVVIDEQDRFVKVISFMLSLLDGVCRPFLIISSSAFISVWESNLSQLAPSINIVAYQGNKNNRGSIRTFEFYNKKGVLMFEALLSSPEVVAEDFEYLKSVLWEAIIVDECQHSKSLKHLKEINMLTSYMRFLHFSGKMKASSAEYVNLLSFLDHGFNRKSSHHLEIESNANSSELKERLTQYIAYERKLSSSRVVEYWVPVQLSSMQLEQYCSTLLSNSMLLRSQSKNDSADHLEDVLISLRKCCDHPYLVDQSLQSFVTKGLPFSAHADAEINLSGKLKLLDKMLIEIKARGLRVVIIFQSLGGSGRYSVGDILDDFVYQRFGADSYTRITGGSYVASKKQAALDMFNNKECGNFVLLIENRACLRSIKLVSVDTVILFDTDWEPRNDIRALEKMTIESQFEQLKVFRLYTSSTVEEKILILAKEGVTLDSNIWNLNWSSFQSLLQWGASYLFEKLDDFHGSQSHTPIDEETFLRELLSEFSSQLPYKGKSSNPLNCSKISKVDPRRGVYPTNILLLGESHLVEENEPSVFFWTKLLEGRHPRWKLLSGSSQRTRRRVNFFDGFRKLESGSDHATVISEKMVNTNLEEEELAENHITGIAEGYNDKSKKGIELHNAQTIVQSSLKPEISKLCHILQFPEGIKGIALRFLDFVVNEYNVGCDAASTLQAFQLSLCWAAALFSKHEIDHKKSFALAKLHLNFDCKETEARYIYSKLKKLKNVYAQHKRKSMCSKKSPGARDLNPTKSVLGGQKGEMEKSPQRHEKLLENKQKVVQEFNTTSEKGRAKLEEEHRLESALIRSRFSEISVRLDKLKELNHNFRTRVDEQNRQMDICCKNPEATRLSSGLKKVSHSEKHLADGKLFDNISTAIENSNATPKSWPFSEHHTCDKVSQGVLSVAPEICVDEVTISILDDAENHRTETTIYEEPLSNAGIHRKSEESHENCESIIDSTEPCPETDVLTIQSAVQPSEVPQKLLTKVFEGDDPKEMGTATMQLTTGCEQRDPMTSDIAAVMEVSQEQDNAPPTCEKSHTFVELRGCPSQCSISPLHQMPLATSPPSLVNSRATIDTYMETQPNQNKGIMSSQQAHAPKQPVIENTSGLLRNPVMHHPANFPMTSDRATITEVPQEQDDVPPTCEESHTLRGFPSKCSISSLHQLPLSTSPPSLVNSRAIIHSYMETQTNQNNGIMSSQQAHAPRQPVIEDASGLLRIPVMHHPANFPMQLSTDVLMDGSVPCVSDRRSSRIPQSVNDHSPPTRSDPLLNEMERIIKNKEQIFRIHSETKSKLISDCSKEIEEIQKKYDTLLQDAETSLVQKTNELDTCYNKVRSNQLLGVLMNTYTKAPGSSVAQQAMPTSITNQHQLSTQQHNGNRRVVLSQSAANALITLPTADSPLQVASYSPAIISPALREPHFRSILRLGENPLARIGLRAPPPHLRPLGSPWPVSSSQIPHFPYGTINPHFPYGTINPQP